MDETLKYFKLSGGGIQGNVMVVGKSDKVDLLRKKYADYALEEAECPENAEIVYAGPRLELALFMEYNPAAYLDDVYANVKSAKYDGPNCGRCQNRFRYSEFCTCHYRQTKPCYRFKLER